jgi:hypothetical protein
MGWNIAIWDIPNGYTSYIHMGTSHIHMGCSHIDMGDPHIDMGIVAIWVVPDHVRGFFGLPFLRRSLPQ